MKYKAGDKVRIVNERKSNMNDKGKMDKWLGKVMTIKYACSGYYKMVEDCEEYGGTGWYWYENLIECAVPSNEKIVITTDGKITTARLYTDGKAPVLEAVAKLNPEDDFDFMAGAKLAFRRLWKNEPICKERGNYNGKVVCVKGNGLDECGFTQGKIYNVKNGKIKYDGGCVCSGTFKSFNELNKSMMAKFVELVEDKK